MAASNKDNAFVIRETTAADAAKLPAVERSAGQAFRSIPELAWIADDTPQTVQRHLELMQSGVSWVAAVGEPGVVVGFLNGQLLDGYLHIWEMSVDREHQGRGIGKRLVQAAVGHATRRNLKGLTLTTFIDIPWNDAFYKARGFTILEPEDLSQQLVSILNDEDRDGLPRKRRCAMKLELLP
ncbi:GCN5- N-acetyltransferase [Cordyceps fumosorosea ARSEF 2679]|uniref:GCN5-N-acetyltransferase n=1 Tax=Cordyceps fumosorosea (strain ARSEF 2679) TaxID=1081104 RepID=A0A167RKA8_CORFA|nr:GCN5- N-acetyltransferase [Cordyceps fumosorosea ARSEF 2679]OAA58678.1 GCN5- N-acetyltransferase [Cordyceps fumosorosea ARSEF 2679]